MMANNTTNIEREGANKLKITRQFAAPVEQVWKAWTQPELLDLWWAPKPWKTHTKSMDFREGGTWLYSMVGPEGEEHFCLCNYKTITPGLQYTGLDAFCDEQGNINTEFPRMAWQVDFSKSATGTLVQVIVTFETEADLEKIVEMGFKEGFTAAHQNLDEVLEKESVS